MKDHHSPSTNTGNAAIERISCFVSSTRSSSGNVSTIPCTVARDDIRPIHRENPASPSEAPRRVGFSNWDDTPGAHHSASWVARYPVSGGSTWIR